MFPTLLKKGRVVRVAKIYKAPSAMLPVDYLDNERVAASAQRLRSLPDRSRWQTRLPPLNKAACVG
jgi:hypothetical protein